MRFDSIAAALTGGGALLFTTADARAVVVLALPSFEAAEQLATELDNGFATPQEAALRYQEALEHIAAERARIRRILVWLRDGKRLGLDVSEQESGYTHADGHLEWLESVGRAGLIDLLALVDDPLLTLEATFPVLEPIGNLGALEYVGAETPEPPPPPPRAATSGNWVIGADPGATTGLALVSGNCLLASRSTVTPGESLRQVVAWVRWARTIDRRVEMLAVERFGNLQFTSAERLRSLHHEGALVVAAELLGLRVVRQSPAVISTLVEGGGRRLKQTLDWLPSSPHEIDAVAHAWYAGQLARERFRRGKPEV